MAACAASPQDALPFQDFCIGVKILHKREVNKYSNSKRVVHSLPGQLIYPREPTVSNLEVYGEIRTTCGGRDLTKFWRTSVTIFRK